VQNEYLREVRKVDGRLENVEIQTIATAVKADGTGGPVGTTP